MPYKGLIANVDQVSEQGVYFVQTGSLLMEDGSRRTDIYGIMAIFETGIYSGVQRQMQILIDFQSPVNDWALFVRACHTVDVSAVAWTEIALAKLLPKFVGNTDPNNLPQFSICYCVNQANAPANYFWCLTLGNSNDGAQIGVSTSGDFYSRGKENGNWNAWK